MRRARYSYYHEYQFTLPDEIKVLTGIIIGARMENGCLSDCLRQLLYRRQIANCKLQIANCPRAFLPEILPGVAVVRREEHCESPS